METRASYVLVGAFVLGLIAAGIFAILLVAGGGTSDNTKNFRIYFTGNVTGLKEGSKVHFRGIPVGEVTEIGFFKNNTELIEVHIKVKQNTPVKAKTVAEVETQLLGGSASVLLRGGDKDELRGGDKDEPNLLPKKGEDYAVLQGVPSDIAQITSDAKTALANIARVAGKIEDILDKNNRKEIAKALKSANTLMESADKTVKRVGELAHTADKFVKDLRPAAQKLPDAIKTFTATGNEARKLLKENRRPLRDFTASGLQEFSLFLVDARRFVRSFNRVLIKLENDPSGFLFGNQQKGFRGR